MTTQELFKEISVRSTKSPAAVIEKQIAHAHALAERIELWPIDRLVPYANNPRKNDAAVDRMCASIAEFGFKIPCLVRSDGEVVDGHLRLKAARKLGIAEVPVIICDEWSPAQVKAFRLMVNRSVGWANWDDELLAQELREIEESGFDLSLTGFDSKEIDDLITALNDDDQADDVPSAPGYPSEPSRRSVALWTAPRPVQRRDQPGRRGATASREQAIPHGDGSALRHRVRFRVA
jgi:ParB-like chromosome segregation protein Spo0J